MQSQSRSGSSLPIPLPLPRSRVRSGSGGDHQELFAIADAAAVLPPSHFASVSGEIRAGDMMMSADLCAAKAGEVAFRVVGAGAFV